MELSEEFLRAVMKKNESIAYAHKVMEEKKDKIDWN